MVNGLYFCFFFPSFNFSLYQNKLAFNFNIPYRVKEKVFADKYQKNKIIKYRQIS